MGLAVDAPDDAVLAPADGGVTLTVHPGARSPTTLAVTRATVAPAGDRALVSAGGLRVRYAVGRWEGGSGGPEATVDATVHGGGGAWRVRCRAQSELGAPEDACLALLRSLRRWDTLAR